MWVDFRTQVRVYSRGVRVGEAAERAGVNVETIRYYERRGLLPAPEPTTLADCATRETADLPFLAPALRRLLEELPAAADGLSRTERSALETIAAGASTAAQALAAASSAAGVARRREGQSVSSSLAVSSPRPAKDGLPGKEPITISSGSASTPWASASTSRSWSWS